MQLASLRSYATLGIEALDVHIEVHLASGLPGLTIVGLPETEVRESRDRVRSAILNSGFEFPARRITVNLAPADLPKHGGRFDLPIALGVLIASGQVEAGSFTKSCVFLGELALSGQLRAVNNLLAAAVRSQQQGLKLICPQANEAELQPFFIEHVHLASQLLEVTGHLQQQTPLPHPQPPDPAPLTARDGAADMADVLGQHQARRALEIAAAGRHNLLMYGPPGSGKSMLATRLAGILPPLSPEEHLQCAVIHAAAGAPLGSHHPPVRCPHHTSSAVALVGGGNLPKPGEISLAHGGVLFLDEFAEFGPKVLQALREPLENGQITLARANYKCSLPARFQLVAAMNPCPCGHLGSNRCRCSEAHVRRYLGRISGPLLDRIDLHLPVQQPDRQSLLGYQRGEPSGAIRARVVRARQIALQRQGCANGDLGAERLEATIRADQESLDLVQEAGEGLQLSARAMHRLLRVARTIADLDQSEALLRRHLAEALSLRQPAAFIGN